MDHVRELQGRLFAVVGIFIVLSAAAYPFFDQIANFLLAPLGKEHELVYLTPGGAFSFIIQVCMYVGFVGALPAIIYNIYRFVMPVMKKRTFKWAIIFTMSSFVLAVAGMVFAYYVSLPAALYFLTSFDLYHINPMLTIDSYFSFVMTYELAGALLFQIPLVMLLINGATPLKPKDLMKHQDKIILGSFIVAAIISPTPDALNQILLASPIVVMYQVGIVMVWFVNRRHAESVAQVKIAQPVPVVEETPSVVRNTLVPPITPVVTSIQTNTPRVAYSIDGFAMRSSVQRQPVPQLRRPLPIMRSERQIRPRFQTPVRRSIDGFVIAT